MAYEVGDYWLAPGQSTEPWLAWGDPGTWMGAQFIQAKPNDPVNKILRTVSHGMVVQRWIISGTTFVGDWVYYVTVTNPTDKWVRFSLAGL